MGGAGEDFGRTIHAWTDAQGWVVVAPTFRYGDWRDPAQVTREASEHLPRMAAILDLLPEIAGLPVQSQVLLYGYSRGGQTANRFALAFPERVAGAALISSGTYTLPSAAFRGEGDATALRFPYGIANLSELVGRSFDAEAFTRVPFWIGVGARDSDPADVPHQWDPYIGDDRVERAQRFAAWLDEVGARAQVQVFPGVGHGEHEAVRAGAMGFLAGVK
jgi:poly(3-hydroxybutyrate) depolymerase